MSNLDETRWQYVLHKSWNQYIQSLTKDVYDEVCQYADIVLIEADDSRRKLLKLC